MVEATFPVTVVLSVLPCRGGEEFVRRLFEPLGYSLSTRRLSLDSELTGWGESPYFRVELAAQLPIRRRYLKHQRSLVDRALEQRTPEEPEPDDIAQAQEAEEATIAENISLNEQRLGAVMAVLKGAGATHVLDLGCGEGRLLRQLLKEKQISKIVGINVSHRALEIAGDRLRCDRLTSADRDRLQLQQGSLNYRDERISDFDAAAVVEVIEHLDGSIAATAGS